jgi:hypothetical protein
MKTIAPINIRYIKLVTIYQLMYQKEVMLIIHWMEDNLEV